jgi:hypothetical protein
MGRTRTWLVAAAVALLAAAAVVDAVVGRPSGDEAPQPAPPERTEAASQRDAFLEGERVVGRILYTDQDCRVRTLELPQATARSEPRWEGCEFATSRAGQVGLDGFVPAPEEAGEAGAICRGGSVELRAAPRGEAGVPLVGPLLRRREGCAPAWRPDGTLTVVRAGEIVGLGTAGVGAARTLLGRKDLERAFAGPPWSLRRPRVAEAVWLDDALAAVIVRDDGEDLLALFRHMRLVATTPSPYDRLSGLRVSPRGTYVAAQIADAPALVLLDREGEFVPVGLRGHAITWSQDEVFAAVAAPEAVFVFETGGRASRFARIPVRARDVFWR